MIRNIIFGLFTAFLFLAVTGCSENLNSGPPEIRDGDYERGLQLLKEGRNHEALNAFLIVIERRRDAPQSQLQAGNLYLQHLKDPISAIYHFRKYLETDPQSARAERVRQLIETSMKEFARIFPAKPFEDPLERLDLLELVEQVRKENLELKRQLLAAKTKLGKKLESVSERDVKLPPVPEEIELEVDERREDERFDSQAPVSRPTSYVVEPGDNLSLISEKLYGSAARWMDIYQANRGLLDSPHDLKVGEELRIP